MNFSYRAVLRAAFTHAKRVRKTPGSRRRSSFLRLSTLIGAPLCVVLSAALFLEHLFTGKSIGYVLWDLFLVLFYAGFTYLSYSKAAAELGDPASDGLPR